MTFPVRLSLVTYNLWGTERWPQRAPALREFCVRYRPDVLCVQELTETTRAFLDEELAAHARVDDDDEVWTTESNVWWRSDLFEHVDHGATEFGSVAYPERRLCWVRLRPSDHDRTFVVSTVHLTDQATEELTTGVSPRVHEIRAVVATLGGVVADGEAAFVTGDLNDPLVPAATLFGAGYWSCFGALGQLPPSTFPTSVATFGAAGFSTAWVFDWIVANRHARAIAASSPHVYADDLAPSDHWPVHAVYELV